MLKIDIELIKHENANATTRPIGFQIFENLRKMKNFETFFRKFFFYFFILKFLIFLTRHSTSPPCGNQVDGLAHDVHNTETVAKPGRLGSAKNGTTPP